MSMIRRMAWSRVVPLRSNTLSGVFNISVARRARAILSTASPKKRPNEPIARLARDALKDMVPSFCCTLHMVDVALQQLPEADGRHAIMGGLPHRNREEVGRGRSFSPN